MQNKITKEKKLSNANLSGINVSDVNKIYINENLIKASRNLLYHARRFRKKID